MSARRKASQGRAGLGAVYTPAAIVDDVLAQVLEGLTARPGGVLRVCDPACGDGRFLVAAAREIARRFSKPIGEVVATSVYGVDIDPEAVEATRRALLEAAGGGASVARALERRVRCADALCGCPVWAVPEGAERGERDAWCREYLPEVQEARLFHWDTAFAEVFRPGGVGRGGFDAIVGNPPFLNQLETVSAVSRAEARLRRARFHGAVRGYADTSAAFMMLAHELCREGGRIGFVMPQSFLTARDAAGVRQHLAERSSLRSLWLAGEHAFAASVYACSLVLEKGCSERVRCRVAGGLSFEEAKPVKVERSALAEARTWAHLAAGLAGVPDVAFEAAGALGDRAAVTADFRDEYYALREVLVEAHRRAAGGRLIKVVTTGLIDPAQCAWGERPVRLFREVWQAPVLDVGERSADSPLVRWLGRRLRPKILLATQTRVLEVAVDAEGTWAPVTPLISIVPTEPEELWRLAAALASPVASMWAMRHYAGAALHADAIKLAAADVRRVPLPAGGSVWDAAAEAFRRASEAAEGGERREHLVRSAELSLEAYGVAVDERPALLRWWGDRLPRSQVPTKRA